MHIGALLLAGLLIPVLFLFLTQRSQIYFPRRYDPGTLSGLSSNVRPIAFSISQGAQTAYYVPPAADSSSEPEHLWIFFGGNAMLARNWLQWIDSLDAATSGFLLVDYPGYGDCAGKPTRDSINHSAGEAFAALADSINVDPAALARRTSVLGQSLGCAAALEFATRHPVQRLVLLSPFTSLMDMARRQLGWPLCNLLLDRFDNRARLHELSLREDRPAVIIFHGGADTIVPVQMSRELASLHEGWIVYHEVPGYDHDLLYGEAEQEVLQVIREDMD